MTQPTPGPWAYDSYNTIWDNRRRIMATIPDHPTDDDHYTPEQIEERSAWYAESEANAFLVAAAPDLLVACRVVTAFLDQLETGLPEDDPLRVVRRHVHAPLLAVLRSAIAKSEGKINPPV